MTPTQYKAEIVRPLARKHGDKTLPATEADKTYTMTDESGREIEVHMWDKLYFLERQLKGVTDKRKKQRLRHMPLKVMAIYDPDYDEPLLVGTPLLSLKPEAAYKIYVARWPVEGLPQTGKYILSGGTGTHYVHHPTAMERLPDAITNLWVSIEICSRNLAAFPNRLLGQSAETNLWAIVTVFKKSWYPFIWSTFQKGVSYRPFACWL